MTVCSAEFAIEPGFGCLPVARYGVSRDFQHLGSFFDAQSAEEAQFDDPYLARIKGRQRVEGLIERADVCITLLGNNERFLQFDLPRAAAAFEIVSGAGHIHQDAPHELS